MTLLGLGLFLSGIVLTLLAVRLLSKRRMALAAVQGTAGLSLLSMGAILTLIFFNLHTYQSLTREIQVAQIEIGDRIPEGIPVKLQNRQGERVFLIQAPEWQLDARFLKWQPWAYLIGSEPMVRLETLSGRLSGMAGEKNAARFPLSSTNPLLGDMASKVTDWSGMVDTYYGSSVYMPAVEGAVYSVSASVSGLLARAENRVAKQAVSRWMQE
jgi:hypothetical protein